MTSFALLSIIFLRAQAKPLAIPPYAPALSRALSWDERGAYPFDAEKELSASEKQIIQCVSSAELGRAESLAAYSLKTNEKDLVPAWILSQIVRVRKKAMAEYERLAPQLKDPNVSAPNLLYRFHICRLAEEEIPQVRKRTGDPLFDQVLRDQIVIRDLCRPFAKQHLGFAIAITQTTPYWVLVSRPTIAEYHSLHPEGPDVRALICQSLLMGLHIGPLETFLTPKATAPEEPQPQHALEVAQTILKDRPNDALGHYYVGVSQFLLKRTDLALKEFRLALNTASLPPVYVQAAKAFIDHPGFAALRPKVEY